MNLICALLTIAYILAILLTNVCMLLWNLICKTRINERPTVCLLIGLCKGDDMFAVLLM